MRVRVIRAYGPFSIDHIVENMPDNQANEFINRGFVERAPVTEDVSPSPVDRMIDTGRQATTKSHKRR